jgi:tetratricopeptide (TPR) repeat protein
MSQQQLDRVFSLYSSRRFDEALSGLAVLLNANPSDPILHNTAGAIHGAMGNHSSAETSYERALNIAPDFAEARNNLGTSLKAQGRYSDAIAHFQLILEQHPNHPDVQFNLLNAERDRGNRTVAIEGYKALLRHHPNYISAHNNLANLLSEDQETEQARQGYRRSLTLRPEQTDAWFNLAKTETDAGENSAAMPLFIKAIQVVQAGPGRHRIFYKILKTVKPTRYSTSLAECYLHLISDERKLRLATILHPAVRLLLMHPSVSRMLKLAETDSFANEIDWVIEQLSGLKLILRVMALSPIPHSIDRLPQRPNLSPLPWPIIVSAMNLFSRKHPRRPLGSWRLSVKFQPVLSPS